LIGYAAMALHRAAVLKMAEQCSAVELAFLNQSHPELGVKVNSFKRWKREMFKPDTLLKLGFNASYTNLLDEQIHIPDDPDIRARREALAALARQNTEICYDFLVKLDG
jgi:hypothetical protein